MKANDLRERTTEDLLELERSLALDCFQNRFKNFTNRLDDTSLIRKTRRDLARVKGIIADRGRVLALSKLESAAESAAVEAPAKADAPAEPTVQASELKASAEEKKASKAKPSAKKGKPASSEGESK